jgi:hypothetical protein
LRINTWELHRGACAAGISRTYYLYPLAPLPLSPCLPPPSSPRPPFAYEGSAAPANSAAAATSAVPRPAMARQSRLSSCPSPTAVILATSSSSSLPRQSFGVLPAEQRARQEEEEIPNLLRGTGRTCTGCMHHFDQRWPREARRVCIIARV